jgi:crotonobetainyl-CoA:carnitine CoA-transferase CaiB-like acyl-CoA transferase
MWMAFCEKVIVQPDWLERPDYRTQALRVKNVDALERDIESVTTLETTAHWVALLDAVGIPGGPVLAQLGYSAQDTEALFQQGAVFDQYRDKARPNA